MKTHPSHKTRISDASRYDEVCDVCGATDAAGDRRLGHPCKEYPFDVFQSLIDQITYKPGWYFRTGIEDNRMWVQVGVTEEAEIAYDVVDKRRIPWKGAKHFLSEHMCRNEIVSTCYHAIERAELHEVREWFRYKKRSIFNPHLDPDALVEVASKARNFNTRENAMTMEEPT
jgi:hypothetical protein